MTESPQTLPLETSTPKEKKKVSYYDKFLIIFKTWHEGDKFAVPGGTMRKEIRGTFIKVVNYGTLFAPYRIKYTDAKGKNAFMALQLFFSKAVRIT